MRNDSKFFAVLDPDRLKISNKYLSKLLEICISILGDKVATTFDNLSEPPVKKRVKTSFLLLPIIIFLTGRPIIFDT